MNFKIGVELVGLAGEQRFELLLGDFLFQSLERVLGLGNDRVVILGFAKLDQPGLVFKLALDLADASELVFERGALLHQLLSFLRIVPQIGVLGERVQLGKTRG